MARTVQEVSILIIVAFISPSEVLLTLLTKSHDPPSRVTLGH